MTSRFVGVRHEALEDDLSRTGSVVLERVPEDPADLLVQEHARKAVRAKQEDVARAHDPGYRVRVRGGRETDALGEHVAERVASGLFLRQVLRVNPLLHPRVVMCELDEIPVAEAIRP
jgi:hypothetical protein